MNVCNTMRHWAGAVGSQDNYSLESCQLIRAFSAMVEKLFPTFSQWLKPIVDIRLGVWKLRGPTWYIATWLGDPLATQQRSLVRVLAVAHQERLELAPLIQCLAQEHRGRYRRLLRGLGRRLDSGTSLVDALEQTPDVLADESVLALRFGIQTGTLQSAFGMLLSRDLAGDLNPNSNARHIWLYWGVLAVTIALQLMFMMHVILPTFKKMFAEFELHLPTPLQALIVVCDVLAKYAALWMLVGLLVVGLCWSSVVRRFFRRSIAPLFMPPIALLRRAELLKLLAIGVDAGRPLAASLSTLARYHFDSRVRQRLLFARNEIEQGVDSWQGLTFAGFLTPQQSYALTMAPNNEIRVWTLRRLASGMQVAAQQRTYLGFALMQPAVVLVFASIVLFIFVSFFSVLLAMITSLA